MKIATISHSHIAPRQQVFFREVAAQGHEVLMIAPGEWGSLRTKDYYESWPEIGPNPHLMGEFTFKTCRHMFGDSIYDYNLLGARGLVEEFNPDWLYVQAEPGSAQSREALNWLVKRRAIFTWENIELKSLGEEVGKYDLVVCGNPEAEALMKQHNLSTLLLLQVGVDTDHFCARPGIARDIHVGYVGRRTPEKGLPYLSAAWPTVHMLEWKSYNELPWLYSQLEVVVAYSQDVPMWKEQAPNYVVLEALSCGCKAVTSDTAAMAYWLEGCPGVVKVEGHKQTEAHLSSEKVNNLRKGIARAAEIFITDESRTWVMNKFGNPVVARQLVEAFNAEGL